MDIKQGDQRQILLADDLDAIAVADLHGALHGRAALQRRRPSGLSLRIVAVQCGARHRIGSTKGEDAGLSARIPPPRRFGWGDSNRRDQRSGLAYIIQ
jgi:hypothetical protein